MGLTVAITGGRDHHPSLAECEAARAWVLDHGVTTLRHGCARGVDTLVSGYVQGRGLASIERWPADWAKHGSLAGPLRNEAMLLGDGSIADALLAFEGGRGTDHCIGKARNLGIPVVTIEPMAEPRIANRHHGPVERGVYVGRGTPLGNPVPLSLADGQARADAAAANLEHYRAWLAAELRKPGSAALAMLDRIESEDTLVCSCWPAHCHAEVIVHAWRWRHLGG